MKKHLKRLATPRTWNIKRKERVFITRPYPGKHSLRLSIPLSILLKDFLKIVNTTREAKKLINSQEVLIDCKRVRDTKIPVGFMDVIDIKGLNRQFIIGLNKKGKIDVAEISKEEGAKKYCRIIGKKKLKMGKLQLNLSDGRNIMIEKDSYKIGDSLILELPSQKIKEHLKLEKGAMIVLTGGKNIGNQGKVESVKERHLVYSTKEGKGVTLKKYGFVVKK